MGQFGEVVAEDLGPVPPILRPSLERAGVPGYRVLRWEKDGDKFRDPSSWPESSVATNATHDTDTTATWYDGLPAEAREHLRELPGMKALDVGRPFDDSTRDLILRLIYSAPSTLSIVPFQDALGGRQRINTPGTVGQPNWSFRAEQTVDDLLADGATIERLAKLAAEAGRSRAR
jgi:4-alpha-glucanotransferase